MMDTYNNIAQKATELIKQLASPEPERAGCILSGKGDFAARLERALNSEKRRLKMEGCARFLAIIFDNPDDVDEIAAEARDYILG